MFNRTLLVLSLSALLTSPLYAQSLIDQPLQLSAPEEPLKVSNAEPTAIANKTTETSKKATEKAEKKVEKKAKEVAKEKNAVDSNNSPITDDIPKIPAQDTPTKTPAKPVKTSSNTTLNSLNNAQWSATLNEYMLAKAQVMLDNAHTPAGAIDATAGEKTDRALRSFQIIYGLTKTGKLDKATWDKLVELNKNQDVFMEYTITKADVDKKLYVSSVPTDYGLKSKMSHLGYTRVSEMLGEKFHLDETYLKKLNPNAKFVAGEKIIVTNVNNKLPTDIVLIVANKTVKQLYLFNSKNQMVGSLPATFGNDPKALVGDHTITGITRNPWYSYSPSNFVQGNNLKPLSIPPGPNGPVGNIWIGLSKKSFGIHGTPDPSKISTNNSHGCIRLSNWDANILGNYVQKGVKVRFVD